MLDKTRAERTFDGYIGNAQRTLRIATRDEPAAHQVAVASFVEQWCGFGAGLRHGQGALKFRPFDRKSARIECSDRFGRSDNRGDCLTPETRSLFGEHRLIGKFGNNPETVPSRNVGGGQNGFHTVIARQPRIQIAKAEGRTRVGRADYPDFKRAGWCHVVAEFLHAGHLVSAVEPTDGRARITAMRQMAGCFHDRVDDLSVAGASAQHPAQRIHDSVFIWRVIAAQ